MAEPYFVHSTGDPAVGIDSNATIIDWNSSATTLFGYTSEQVIGKKCWKVLEGCDQFGNGYCTEDCPIMKMARRGQTINHSEMCFQGKSAKPVRAGVSTLVLSGPDAKFTIVHLFTPPGLDSPPSTGRASELLTSRESEVMKLLCVGTRTSDIAFELAICEATARNHVNHILRKLKVHSRLEAVCEARRLGLDLIDAESDKRLVEDPVY